MYSWKNKTNLPLAINYCKEKLKIVHHDCLLEYIDQNLQQTRVIWKSQVWYNWRGMSVWQSIWQNKDTRTELLWGSQGPVEKFQTPYKSQSHWPLLILPSELRGTHFAQKPDYKLQHNVKCFFSFIKQAANNLIPKHNSLNDTVINCLCLLFCLNPSQQN